MSGRLVIAIMAVAAIIMSFFFYRTLTTSGQHRELATEQMKLEFRDYAARKNVEKLKIAEQNGTQYFVEMKEDWNFLISDRTLVVTPPDMTSLPAGMTLPPTGSTNDQAKKTIHDFVYEWLVEKYRTQKDIKVVIRLKGEPQPPVTN